jgi:hypothetical protein
MDLSQFAIVKEVLIWRYLFKGKGSFVISECALQRTRGQICEFRGGNHLAGFSHGYALFARREWGERIMGWLLLSVLVLSGCFKSRIIRRIRTRFCKDNVARDYLQTVLSNILKFAVAK